MGEPAVATPARGPLAGSSLPGAALGDGRCLTLISCRPRAILLLADLVSSTPLSLATLRSSSFEVAEEPGSRSPLPRSLESLQLSKAILPAILLLENDTRFGFDARPTTAIPTHFGRRSFLLSLRRGSPKEGLRQKLSPEAASQPLPSEPSPRQSLVSMQK